MRLTTTIFPRPEFWRSRTARLPARVATQSVWTNVYRYFHSGLVWPRGLPLDQVNAPLPELVTSQDVYCPIQQGLADDNPDVDAIYRLLLPIPFRFEFAEAVALRGAVVPVQQPEHHLVAGAFPLLYLPYHCSFRMTDIWRSFVAQRIAYANGWAVLFHAATVFQERNAHDLMRDFAEEVPGIFITRPFATRSVGSASQRGLLKSPMPCARVTSVWSRSNLSAARNWRCLMPGLTISRMPLR